MYERLKHIIEKGCDAVLNDPSLLIEMIRIYALLYLNGESPSFCGKCHKDYFEKLKKYGLTQLEKMEQNKFKLKENVLIYDFKTGEYLSRFNMTDEKAIQRLRAHPKAIGEFSEFPENWQELIKEESNVKASPKTNRPTRKGTNKAV